LQHPFLQRRKITFLIFLNLGQNIQQELNPPAGIKRTDPGEGFGQERREKEPLA
jgi:hypothetical protein